MTRVASLFLANNVVDEKSAPSVISCRKNDLILAFKDILFIWGAATLGYSGYECFLIIYLLCTLWPSQSESLSFKFRKNILCDLQVYFSSTLFPVLSMTSLFQILRFAD